MNYSRSQCGIPTPTASAEGCYAASVASTAMLTQLLKDGTPLGTRAYTTASAEQRRLSRRGRVATETAVFDRVADAASAPDKRRMTRAKETGAWLTTTPNFLNGTVLSADEFRDSLRLRYGLAPLNLPEPCDGCNARFSCKTGGLVLLRHNDVAAKWHQLCAMALTPSMVSDEPLIHTGRAPGGTGPHGTEL